LLRRPHSVIARFLVLSGVAYFWKQTEEKRPGKLSTWCYEAAQARVQKRRQNPKAKPMTRDRGSWSGSRFLEIKEFRPLRNAGGKEPTHEFALQAVPVPAIPYATLQSRPVPQGNEFPKS